MRYIYFIFILFIFSCTSENTIVGEKHDATTDSIKKLSTLDITLPKPTPGDWLYEHKERGQTFPEYINCKPVSPNTTQNVIYIQPLGNFSHYTDSIIDSTVEYLHYFLD